MITESALGVVVGATSVRDTVDYLEVFGLHADDGRALSAIDAATLYGLDRDTTEVACRTAGTDGPSVFVVGCDDAGEAPRGFQRRPRALDVYVADMDEAVERLRFVGLGPGPVGTLSVGPVTMRQCLVPGPDGLAVVLVESTHRRSSILDQPTAAGSEPGARGAPAPLFSEPHSVVWCVDGMDDLAAGLCAVGLAKGPDLAFCEPEVSTYLGLPRSPVPIRMTMLSGADVAALRLELLEFPDDEGELVVPERLVGGFWALRHEVGTGLEDAAAGLAAAGWTVCEGVEGVRTLLSPEGLRLELVASGSG